jgi:hypothetical protein
MYMYDEARSQQSNDAGNTCPRSRDGQGLGDVADLVRSVVESVGDDAELREEDSEFKRKGEQAEGESR